MQEIVRLATKYCRYGYQRVSELLRREGWRVNYKRVERIWRAEGLKGAPAAEAPETPLAERRVLRAAPAPGEGPGVELRLPEWRETSDWQPLRFLTVLDEYNRRVLGRPCGQEKRPLPLFHQPVRRLLIQKKQNNSKKSPGGLDKKRNIEL